MKQDSHYMHIFCRFNSRLIISISNTFYVCLNGLPMVMKLIFSCSKKNTLLNNGYTIAGKLCES